MLESIDIKSVYLINVDYQGNKEVKCLDKYPRIQGTNNPRIMYLKGLFGWVPIVDILDYDTILQELADSLSKESVLIFPPIIFLTNNLYRITSLSIFLS